MSSKSCGGKSRDTTVTSRMTYIKHADLVLMKWMKVETSNPVTSSTCHTYDGCGTKRPFTILLHRPTQ